MYQRHLPHWRQDGATYFVTFRLADSLPQSKLDELKALKAEWEKRRTAGTYVSDQGSPLARRERLKILTERIDALLAEARQMDIPFEEVVKLAERRHATSFSPRYPSAAICNFECCRAASSWRCWRPIPPSIPCFAFLRLPKTNFLAHLAGC